MLCYPAVSQYKSAPMVVFILQEGKIVGDLFGLTRVIRLGPCAPLLSSHAKTSSRTAIMQTSLEIGGPGFGDPGAPGPKTQCWYKHRSKFGALKIVPNGYRILDKKPAEPKLPPVLPLSAGKAARSSSAPAQLPVLLSSGDAGMMKPVGSGLGIEVGLTGSENKGHVGLGFTSPSQAAGLRTGVWLPPANVRPEVGPFIAPSPGQATLAQTDAGLCRHGPRGRAERLEPAESGWEPPALASSLPHQGMPGYARGPGQNSHMTGAGGGLRGPAPFGGPPPQQAVCNAQGRPALHPNGLSQQGGLRPALEENISGSVFGAPEEAGYHWRLMETIDPESSRRVPQRNHADTVQPSCLNSWSRGSDPQGQNLAGPQPSQFPRGANVGGGLAPVGLRYDGPQGQLPNQALQGRGPTSLPPAGHSLSVPGPSHNCIPWPSSPANNQVSEAPRPHGSINTFGSAAVTGASGGMLGAQRGLPRTPSGQMRCDLRTSQGGKRSALHLEILRFADECAVPPAERNSVSQACVPVHSPPFCSIAFLLHECQPLLFTA